MPYQAVDVKEDVFAKKVGRPADSISSPDDLNVIRRIERCGSLEIARKVLQRMNAVFRYAIQTGRATYNPAADMQRVLKVKPVEHLPAVFDSNRAQDKYFNLSWDRVVPAKTGLNVLPGFCR